MSGRGLCCWWKRCSTGALLSGTTGWEGEVVEDGLCVVVAVWDEKWATCWIYVIWCERERSYGYAAEMKKMRTTALLGGKEVRDCWLKEGCAMG